MLLSSLICKFLLNDGALWIRTILSVFVILRVILLSVCSDMLDFIGPSVSGSGPCAI